MLYISCISILNMCLCCLADAINDCTLHSTASFECRFISLIHYKCLSVALLYLMWKKVVQKSKWCGLITCCLTLALELSRPTCSILWYKTSDNFFFSWISFPFFVTNMTVLNLILPGKHVLKVILNFLTILK